MSLADLVRALDDDETASTTTSVRTPTSLRRALEAAVEMGFARTANDATNTALRDSLETFALERALDEHVQRHPEVAPSLADVAQALADLRRDPMAGRPDVIARAAAEVASARPGADAHDVLVWAHATMSSQAS